jgi:hypothetical protein
MRRPNWFDWLVYRLFYWRWNPILRENMPLRRRFMAYWEWWEKITGPGSDGRKPRGDDDGKAK